LRYTRRQEARYVMSPAEVIGLKDLVLRLAMALVVVERSAESWIHGKRAASELTR